MKRPHLDTAIALLPILLFLLALPIALRHHLPPKPPPSSLPPPSIALAGFLATPNSDGSTTATLPGVTILHQPHQIAITVSHQPATSASHLMSFLRNLYPAQSHFSTAADLILNSLRTNTPTTVPCGPYLLTTHPDPTHLLFRLLVTPIAQL